MAQKFITPITIRQLSTAGSDGLTIFVDGDTYARLQVQGGGRLVWGDGTAVGDVNLYRDEANVLRTDDTLKVPALFIDGIEVDTTGATSNQVLKFDGAKFVPGTASTVGSIDDLSDVVITTPEEFQTLEYDGTNWVNAYSSVVSNVRNAEATTLTIGTVVYLFGATGDHATVKRADNTSDTTSSKTIGLVGASIPASNDGPVITRGYVDGIDLSVGYSAGDILWLGENGAFTKIKPTSPDHLVFVGVVVRATNNGIVYVATQNGYELDELHDVSIPSPTAGQVLTFNGSLWTAASTSGGAATSVSDTPPSSPTTGQLWFESDTGLTYIYYDSSWVEIGSGSAYDTVINAIQAKGDLLAGTASQSLDRLAVGTNNQRLIANSSTTTGLSWANDTTNTVIDAKGDLLVGATSDVIAKLPVGTNSQVLVANSSATNGLSWVDQPSSFRNAIINGGFDIWQRGTPVTLASVGFFFTADRWQAYSSSSNTATVTRTAFTTGTVLGNATPKYHARVNSSNSGVLMLNRIEGVETFAGQTVTVSFYARVQSAATVTTAMTQVYGTGSVSGSVQVLNTTFSLTTSWARYSHTFNCPSISGKNVTTNDYLELQISGSLVNNYLDLWGVQVEQNIQATPFEQRPIGVELALCQRYYEAERTILQQMYWASDATGTVYGGSFVFNTAKRAAPTIKTYDAVNTIDKHSTFSAGASRTDNRAANSIESSPTGFSVRGYAVAGAYGYGFYWTAESEL